MKLKFTDGFQASAFRSTKLRSEVLTRFTCGSENSSIAFRVSEHNISGDALCLLDAEGLKGIGISTVGQRLTILKAVYQAKLAHNVPVEADHYVPPCAYCRGTAGSNSDFSYSAEVQERSVTVEKLHDIVKEQGPSTTFHFISPSASQFIQYHSTKSSFT
jgi:hypothetical protein